MPGDNIIDPPQTYHELNGPAQTACIPMKRARKAWSVISDDPHSSQKQTFLTPSSYKYDISDILCFTFDGSMFT